MIFWHNVTVYFETLKSEKELARLEKKLGVERLELDQLKQRFEILDEISVKLSKEWVLKLTVSACYSQSCKSSQKPLVVSGIFSGRSKNPLVVSGFFSGKPLNH